ncbi:EF-hand domain-containing protein [Marimonas arenosa]|uniref:EF-hand domain-containing protein n=1 Tax=Marimonas arenosa TaxID=1795305 RepID=A0AAE3WAJ3_9RHOB|nr:EF-hand domain-containing protein [Marimonas arenosa]MDQ2089184.1 EF-hand domain-containing protein [Marimonas arenosa]
MKINGLLIGALVLAASQAVALPEDANGNGTYSMDEMVAAFPELTADDFAEIDANSDGEVDSVEYADAIAAEIIAE